MACLAVLAAPADAAFAARAEATAELRVKCSTLKQQCAALKKSSREALEMKDQQLVAMKAMADEQRPRCGDGR